MTYSADISVIVPCYNAERHLRVCLESLKAQKAPRIQMILIDDGSKDGTGTILDEFAKGEPRAQVVHKENGGVSSARNCGLELATGRYIAFMDADDALEEGSFMKLYQAAVRSRCQILSADHVLYDESRGCRVKVEVPEVAQQPAVIAREIIHMHRIYNNIWNKLYVRELFDGGLRLDERVRIGEDALLNLQLYLRAKRVAHLGECTYVYRIHGESAMARVKGYGKAHQPMLCGMSEILLEEQVKESYFRDFLQSAVWVDEKEAGIRAAMNRFNAEIRPLVLEGMDASRIAKQDQKLYRCVESGRFPLFYMLQRVREKLTGRKWGIRR